ncbi:hypothetical protein HUJ04_013353 [Dendroctonus ponderosae]|nr:hypothetical protein HUJ04_013353 [Dendroctonus ponderosae]
MDEVLFRGTQKLESLQLEAGLVASKSKDLFLTYSQATQVLLSQVWQSHKLDHLKSNISQLLDYVLEISRDFTERAVDVADPKRLWMFLTGVLDGQWSKREISIACAGFVVGGLVGVAVGFALRRRENTVRYMEAVQISHYLGRKVQRLELGDEVWVTIPFWSQGTLCQTILISEHRVARKPKNVGFEGACSVPYAGSLALSVLSEAKIDLNSAANKRFLIQDGCTPVGCVLIQLLNSWKAHITTTCHKRAVPVAKALGAREVISIDAPSLSDEDHVEEFSDAENFSKTVLKELQLKGEIFDFIIVTRNENLNWESLRNFCAGEGKLLSTLPEKLSSDSYGFLARFIFSTYIRLKFLMGHILGVPSNNYDEAHLCHATLDKLTALVEDGVLQTVVDKVFHPKDIEVALNYIQSSQSIGSSVITFRGDRMCQEALCDLKMAIRAAGEHKQRITINIAIDGLRLRDEKTGDCLYHHPVHKISFIAQDMIDSRAFGYIFGSPDTGRRFFGIKTDKAASQDCLYHHPVHKISFIAQDMIDSRAFGYIFGSPDTGRRFFGIKTDKAASQVVIAMRDLFQVVFALKKKEIELAKQHLEKSYLPTSPLFSDSPNSVSKPSEKSKNEPKGSASASESKNSGTAVADLVDLELELNSLQQGLNQMERITPSDPFGSKDDPFGDSFISYPVNKLILPPPPSSGRDRSSRTSEGSSTMSATKTPPNTAASVDSASDSLFSGKSNKDFSFSHDFSTSHDEHTSGDWFNPSFDSNIFEEPTALVAAEPLKDEKHEAAKQEIMSQFDVFTELDPLGEWSWFAFVLL